MSLRIVFMGTPESAEPSFRMLHSEGHELMVVCQPDRPRGRSLQPTPQPMKTCAQEQGLRVLQPVSVNSEEALTILAEFDPDLFVVVAFGQILKPQTLRLPRLGAVNLHFSLLPRWRGAAPVEYAIWHGDEVTGVTTQFMAVELDAGPVILKRETRIDPTETAGELRARLAELGAVLLSETIDLIEQGKAVATPQDPNLATYAPRISPEQGALDFRLSAQEVSNHVRAFNPRPGCFTHLGQELVKVWLAFPTEGSGAPGEYLGGDEIGGIRIATGVGAISVQELQPSGRARQTGRDFANGRRLKPGARFCTLPLRTDG